jgi:glycosyltransferase involved in cell wall biosynthesis
MSNPNLTFILLTFNEESNMPDLVNQLVPLGFPVFMVDSYSTDNTVSIAKSAGISVVQHEFINYSKQRNWAQEHNPFKTDWVFHLDADERLTDELLAWLKNDFEKETLLYDGFMFGRRAIFMGKWIKSHYNYHLRLYKTNLGKCEDKSYDQHYVMKGKIKKLKKKDLTSKVCDQLQLFISAHNKWSLYEAIDIISKKDNGEVKAKLTGNPIEVTRWFKNRVFQKCPLFVRSIAYFMYRYFIKLGFLEGKEGLIFHFLQAFWFRFLIDAKVYELQKWMKEDKSSLSEVLKKYYNFS